MVSMGYRAEDAGKRHTALMTSGFDDRALLHGQRLIGTADLAARRVLKSVSWYCSRRLTQLHGAARCRASRKVAQRYAPRGRVRGRWRGFRLRGRGNKEEWYLGRAYATKGRDRGT